MALASFICARRGVSTNKTALSAKADAPGRCDTGTRWRPPSKRRCRACQLSRGCASPPETRQTFAGLAAAGREQSAHRYTARRATDTVASRHRCLRGDTPRRARSAAPQRGSMPREATRGEAPGAPPAERKSCRMRTGADVLQQLGFARAKTGEAACPPREHHAVCRHHSSLTSPSSLIARGLLLSTLHHTTHSARNARKQVVATSDARRLCAACESSLAGLHGPVPIVCMPTRITRSQAACGFVKRAWRPAAAAASPGRSQARHLVAARVRRHGSTAPQKTRRAPLAASRCACPCPQRSRRKRRP